MQPRPSNRKYPRAAIDQPGVLMLRATDRRQPARRVPVAIRSISCEGAGLKLGDRSCILERRSAVTVDFSVDGQQFAIPSTVVWIGDGRANGGVDVGVQFQLAVVPSESRQAYARWIVDLLRRHGS